MMTSSWISRCFKGVGFVFNQLLTKQVRKCSVSVNSYALRTHNCGELTADHNDKHVTLCGWLEYTRMGYFATVRDAHGSTQVILTDQAHRDFVEELSFESVIQIKGRVRLRERGQNNPGMKTGEVEVVTDEIKLLNKCKPNLPILPKDAHQITNAVRLTHRYLDLRSKRMQRNLRLRSEFIMKLREILCNKHGFVDVETPYLFRRTPGGAREFVVPTHQKDAYYTLPQSPQQFKQLLMVGGIDRYMQIARCFRDEGAKPDRQPEFTQLDLEMSFVDREGIMCLVEDLLCNSWPDTLGKLPDKFPRMTYKEAMTNYGCDKPDLRYDPIVNITDVIKQSGIEGLVQRLEDTNSGAYALVQKKAGRHFSNTQMKHLSNVVNEQQDAKVIIVKVKPGGDWSGQFDKHMNKASKQELVQMLGLEAGDLFVICYGSNLTCPPILAKIRTEIITKTGSESESESSQDMKFLWVTDFPMFLDKEDGSPGVESAHHPFTAPHPDDRQLLYSEPTRALSLHYDLVLNGSEVGGGSIRIHESDLQRHIFENILHEDSSQIQHLIDALDSGCPPHGGIALGLDRLLAIMCGESSITNVIAFPKNSRGYDTMSGAPANINDDDKEYYHLK